MYCERCGKYINDVEKGCTNCSNKSNNNKSNNNKMSIKKIVIVIISFICFRKYY